jgi:hypothetical protein
LSNGRNSRHERGILRLLGHPTRLPILEVLQLREAGPAELAVMLGTSTATVVSDCEKLAEAGLITEVRTKPRTGEPIYRGSRRSFTGHFDWPELSPSIHNSVLSAGMKTFIDEVVSAFKGGTIGDRENTILNWMPVRVDLYGRRVVMEILEVAFMQLQMAQEQSRQRLRALEEEGAILIVGFAGFEAAEPSPGDSRR